MNTSGATLPPEIWLHILENLPPSDVVHRASLVCKRLLDVSRAPALCKSVSILTQRLEDPAVAEAYSALFKRASLLEGLEVSNLDTDVSNPDTEPRNDAIRRRGGRKRNVFGTASRSLPSRTEELIVDAIKNCPVRRLRIRCFCCPTDRFSHDFFDAMERHALRIQSLTLPRSITADARIKSLPGLFSRLRDLEAELPSGSFPEVMQSVGKNCSNLAELRITLTDSLEERFEIPGGLRERLIVLWLRGCIPTPESLSRCGELEELALKVERSLDRGDIAAIASLPKLRKISMERYSGSMFAHHCKTAGSRRKP